jgi:hypothetical protein
MATRSRDRADPDDPDPDPWIQLKRAVRNLENRNGGKSLRVNLTTQPTESWDWTGDDVAKVVVEEHRQTGEERIVITQP